MCQFSERGDERLAAKCDNARLSLTAGLLLEIWKIGNQEVPRMTSVLSGDWIQAAGSIEVDGVVHARRGNIGHVLEVGPGNWVNVFWEKSGLVTITHSSEYTWLCRGNGER
jgi:hypothetical protein